MISPRANAALPREDQGVKRLRQNTSEVLSKSHRNPPKLEMSKENTSENCKRNENDLENRECPPKANQS